MPFTFGPRSVERLAGVHPDLVRVCNRAIEFSPVDFSITEGLRSAEMQAKYVASGASRTMNGRHLTGHAVDVAAIIEGQARWDFALYAQIAHAFRQGAVACHVPIVWGAIWDRVLNEIEYDLEDAAEKYVERFKRANARRPLVDGPHFELHRYSYPADAPVFPGVQA